MSTWMVETYRTGSEVGKFCPTSCFMSAELSSTWLWKCGVCYGQVNLSSSKFTMFSLKQWTQVQGHKCTIRHSLSLKQFTRNME